MYYFIIIIYPGRKSRDFKNYKKSVSWRDHALIQVINKNVHCVGKKVPLYFCL